jgi:hypothetical protein
MLSENSPKVAQKYLCEKCNYKCCKKSDFNKHILTLKHQMLINANGEIAKVAEIKLHHCSCGKKYKHLPTLSRHKKECKYMSNNEIVINEMTNDNEFNMLKTLLVDVMKSNQELQKQVIDLCKNGTVVTNNNNNLNNIQHTNSHNKTFNLQFFLNETCKDAMNISEFIDNIKLQLCDLENIGKLGYVEGISKIIIKNLNALDVEKRPVHCSDIKREIMYVKDEDTWEKESDEKQKIKQVISSVVSKNLQLLPEFQKKYPECMKSDSKKSDEYNQIIMETMGGGMDTLDKNKEKIIRKIAKEVTIDKN